MSILKPSLSPETTPIYESPGTTRTSPTPQASDQRLSRFLESCRLGLTMLGLLIGATMIGITADTLSVYDSTKVPTSILPLWPSAFNVGPSIALLVGGCVVVLGNALSVIGSKMHKIRTNPQTHTPLSLLTPLLSLTGSIISIAFYYSINASTTEESMQTWTCRWRHLDMSIEPKWNRLCRECEVGIVLAIALVPVQLVVLALAGRMVWVERRTRVGRVGWVGEKGRDMESPTLS